MVPCVMVLLGEVISTRSHIPYSFEMTSPNKTITYDDTDNPFKKTPITVGNAPPEYIGGGGSVYGDYLGPFKGTRQNAGRFFSGHLQAQGGGAIRGAYDLLPSNVHSR